MLQSLPIFLSTYWSLVRDAREADTESEQAPNILLGCILVLALPLLLKRDLHALRYTCYVSFSSCVLLMVAVVYRACVSAIICTREAIARAA
jgi:hypothetical protein